jgi:hypothetical protein
MVLTQSPRLFADPRSLTDLLHDYWFDAEGIRFHPERGTVVVPVYRRAKSSLLRSILGRSEPQSRFHELGRLEFEGVSSCEVVDTERIRFYDLNEVQFDSNEGEITVLTGCPISLRMAAREFRAWWHST